MKKIILLILIFFISENVFGYTEIGGGNCECSSCSDCTDALNTSSCNSNIIITSNIYSDTDNCINNPLNFNNKNLDCNNYQIKVNGSNNAIFIYDKTNIEIKDCNINIQSGLNGVFIHESSYIDISNNIIHGNFSEVGIFVFNSSYIQIEDNEFLYLNGTYDTGILFFETVNSQIKNNIFNSLNYGIIIIEDSLYNIINGNQILSSNIYGLYFQEGAEDNQVNNNKICNSEIFDISDYGYLNTGTNNICQKVKFWSDTGFVGCSEECFQDYCFCKNCTDCENKLNMSNCSEIFLNTDIKTNLDICINGSKISNFQSKTLNCNNYEIEGSVYATSEIGIYLYNNHGVNIKNCKIYSFDYGIKNEESNNIIYSNNLIFYNFVDGMNLLNSNNVNIINTNILQNKNRGLTINNISNLDISGCQINGNEDNGLYSISSNNMRLTGNKIDFNYGGVFLSSLTENAALNQNEICVNYRPEFFYDIKNQTTSNNGDYNLCNVVDGWSDISGNNSCSNTCFFIEGEIGVLLIDEDTKTETIIYIQGNESEIEGEEEQEEDNIIDNFTGAFEGVGFKGTGSQILFIIIFKIALDIMLSMKGVQWQGILILNNIIILFFCIIGWLPLWVFIILFMITILLFVVNLRKVSNEN